jgi:glutamate synthase domain-containing protein 2
LQPADSVQPFHQALLSSPLHFEIRTIADLFQLLHKLRPVNQERPAGLISTEAAYQVDGAPPAQAEKAVANRAVDHRHIQRRQFREDLRDAKQPLRFSGH